MSDTASTPQESTLPTPQEFYASLAGAPTPEQLAALKAQAPNGVIRAFSPDGKRCFLMRGITGLEMRELQQKAVPENSSDPEGEFKLAGVSAACVWTNTTRNGKLDPLVLRASTAGIPDTLWAIVEVLSDYFAPAQIFNMCFDL